MAEDDDWVKIKTAAEALNGVVPASMLMERQKLTLTLRFPDQESLFAAYDQIAENDPTTMTENEALSTPRGLL